MRFRVSEILKEKKMTQTELARRAEIRPATLSGICRNTCKTVDKEVLARICSVLQCGVDDLFVYEKNNSLTKR